MHNEYFGDKNDPFRTKRYGVVGREGVTEWATSKAQAEQWADYSPSETSVTQYENVSVIESA